MTKAEAVLDMKEAEWLTWPNLDRMLLFLEERGVASQRKLRLLGCAAVRTVEHLFTERGRMGIAVAERWADGHATHADLAAAREDAKGCIADTVPIGDGYDSRYWYQRIPDVVVGLTERQADVAGVAENACCARGGERYWGGDYDADWQQAELSRQHADFLRDIFGNPFRPVQIDPPWRTSTVVRLAKTIYEDRAYNRLAELADALQAAGCSDADILPHCRGPWPHVRGCWVVDLLLGKT